MEFGACLRDVWELSRYLDNITEPLGRQSDRPWAYHFSGSKWKKEVCCPLQLHRTLSQSAVSSNERSAWLWGEHLELMRPPAPSQLHLHGAVSLTETCEEASLPEAMASVGKVIGIAHNIWPCLLASGLGQAHRRCDGVQSITGSWYGGVLQKCLPTPCHALISPPRAANGRFLVNYQHKSPIFSIR
jgi:hypothetical protein